MPDLDRELIMDANSIIAGLISAVIMSVVNLIIYFYSESRREKRRREDKIGEDLKDLDNRLRDMEKQQAHFQGSIGSFKEGFS